VLRSIAHSVPGLFEEQNFDEQNFHKIVKLLLQSLSYAFVLLLNWKLLSEVGEIVFGYDKLIRILFNV
jgi:hypothetical protein